MCVQCTVTQVVVLHQEPPPQPASLLSGWQSRGLSHSTLVSSPSPGRPFLLCHERLVGLPQAGEGEFSFLQLQLPLRQMFNDGRSDRVPQHIGHCAKSVTAEGRGERSLPLIKAWGTPQRRCSSWGLLVPWSQGSHSSPTQTGPSSDVLIFVLSSAMLFFNVNVWYSKLGVWTYIWNLETWYWWTYLQGKNRDTDAENGHVDSAGEREGGTS